MINKKKERRRQVSAFSAIFKADFGRFRPVSTVSASSRYDPIWPIRLDFGRISLVRHESKPIRHESSRIGANRAESAWIWEKKKKVDTDWRAGNRIGRRVPCRTWVWHLWCRVRAFYPISKYLTPYAEKFDSLLNFHASSCLLQSFMI